MPSPHADRFQPRVTSARRSSADLRTDVPAATGQSARSTGEGSRPPLALRDVLAAAALAAVTFAVFFPALRYGFINFDDPDYAAKNDHVRGGITLGGVRWAFTTFTQGNWHPLTWLSLQVDASVWGDRPLGFHLTNVVVHAANAALLFLALRAFTGSFWRSGAVSLLFAVHPLRVESVAWVAERKDVLSVCFGLAAVWAYAGYVRSPSVRRYLPVVLMFALSLACKPTLVTLPCLLLVLDWWPGGRASTARDWRGLVVEKLPLFGLAAASSVLTYVAQAAGGALKPESLSPLARAGNAVVGYGFYLAKTVWPMRLAVFYPHPGLYEGGVDPASVATALLLVAAITGIALRLRTRAPYLLAGWLWYLGALVPMIGLVQVGGQAFADRYSYFPQIGVLIALCWGVADLAGAWPRVKMALATAATIGLVVLTRGQLSNWRDSATLWEHALGLTAPSPLALYNCGEALQSQGRLDEAAVRFQKAVELDPTDFEAHFHLGTILQKQGHLEEATRHFESARQLHPDFATHLALGDIYSRRKLNDEAVRHYEMALELEPRVAATYCNLARVERVRGRLDRAEECYRSALALDPTLAEAHNGFGGLLVDRGQVDQGIAEFREAIRYDARSGQAHNNLGRALEGKQDLAAATEHYAKAAELSPNIGVIWFNLGRARMWQKQSDQAALCFARALELEPGIPPFQAALADALDRLAAAGYAGKAAEMAGRARDQAAAVGRLDLAKQLDGLRERYERGETVPRPSPVP